MNSNSSAPSSEKEKEQSSAFIFDGVIEYEIQENNEKMESFLDRYFSKKQCLEEKNSENKRIKHEE
jgi:hypothetical protein